MITLKRDNKLIFPTIEMPINMEFPDSSTEYKQTNIIGVTTPLFRINNITLPWESISYMKLTCSPVPEVTLKFVDSFGLIKSMDSPGHDNILYLQILPPFDNAYKKIHLSFYISSCNINGNQVFLTGSYYVPKWFDNVMKPYGMISSYELFETISNDYSLGFCSNMDGSTDERYIYNPNLSPVNFLSNEILYSGEKEHVYTWWVDWWNNINLVDLYNEYNSVLSDDDLKIWISSNNLIEITPDYEVKPEQRTALLCNLPSMVGDPLYINQYWPQTSNNITDMNYEVFSMENQESYSTLIQDGDAHNDVFTQYIYGGELVGNYDYLSQRACRGMFINKINSQVIQVSLNRPVLGLMKGGHVNMYWYDINQLATVGSDNSEIKSNIDLPDDVALGDQTSPINKTISGQYYIMDVEYVYNGGAWGCIYTLGRPVQFIERLNPPDKKAFM